jgi:hypothetical protein
MVLSGETAMPFDSTPTYEIADIKLAAQRARAEGRLICDNYRKVAGAIFAEEIEGVVYVCALGAWEEVSHKIWSEVSRALLRTNPVRAYAHALMWAHDELLSARKEENASAIAQAEETFNALLA